MAAIIVAIVMLSSGGSTTAKPTASAAPPTPAGAVNADHLGDDGDLPRLDDVREHDRLRQLDVGHRPQRCRHLRVQGRPHRDRPSRRVPRWAHGHHREDRAQWPIAPNLKLKLTVNHLPALAHGHYVVWLFSSVVKDRRLGPIAPGSKTVTFPLPSGAREYRWIDITRQPPGVKSYSGLAELRAKNPVDGPRSVLHAHSARVPKPLTHAAAKQHKAGENHRAAARHHAATQQQTATAKKHKAAAKKHRTRAKKHQATTQQHTKTRKRAHAKRARHSGHTRKRRATHHA